MQVHIVPSPFKILDSTFSNVLQVCIYIYIIFHISKIDDFHVFFPLIFTKQTKKYSLLIFHFLPSVYEPKFILNTVLFINYCEYIYSLDLDKFIQLYYRGSWSKIDKPIIMLLIHFDGWDYIIIYDYTIAKFSKYHVKYLYGKCAPNFFSTLFLI